MKIELFILFSLMVFISTISMLGSKLFASQFNLLMDKPNVRSSHLNIVPRCGGIPVVVLFFCCALFFANFFDRQILGYLLGGFLIALIGLLDDFINLRGIYKIVGMVSSALVPLFFGLKLNYFEIVMNNQIILYILTFLWIYGMINAFNFMDGIDGLVGGLSVIFSFFILIFALISSNNFVIWAALVLGSTCLGFLFFNYSPASVFLGDAGSMFLGYNFAFLSIMVTNQSANNIPIYTFVLVFATVIYDSMVTFVKRGFEGKKVIEAHREHLYQRLIIMGFSHRSVSILYFLFSIIFGVAAIFFIKYTVDKIATFLLSLLILMGFSYTVRILEQKKRFIK